MVGNSLLGLLEAEKLAGSGEDGEDGGGGGGIKGIPSEEQFL